NPISTTSRTPRPGSGEPPIRAPVALRSGAGCGAAAPGGSRGCLRPRLRDRHRCRTGLRIRWYRGWSSGLLVSIRRRDAPRCYCLRGSPSGEHPLQPVQPGAREHPMPDTLTNSPIIAAYRAATPGSAERAGRAADLFPSGITHDSRYIEPYGLYITRAEGPRKWDVDGRCYVDYFGGHGAMLLGHCNPAVMQAVHAQLDRGTH